MHILTVTTNTASGGDFVSLTASSCPDGWFFDVSDSCGLEFVPPVDTLKEMPDEEGLMKFVDAIRLEGETAFRGLVFGFLEANYSSDRVLTEEEKKEAEKFIEVESTDFPNLAVKYRKRLKDWISARD